MTGDGRGLGGNRRRRVADHLYSAPSARDRC
jgi:hypothetical protein